MTQLRAYKDNGQILFDTSLISYGLIKSGYLTYSQSWTRRIFRGGAGNPDYGGDYSEVQVLSDPTLGDALHTFTVYNAISPISFIVGRGYLNGTKIEGNATIFFYSGASSSTKFYCFDLMSNNIAGSPYLKTFNSSGVLTFNSLQPPINIIASVQAPPVPTVSANGYENCYQGGTTQPRPFLGPTNALRHPQADSFVNINLAAGFEYAAYLTFSRSAAFFDNYTRYGGFSSFAVYGGQEGAYGRNGGITFSFGPSAGGNLNNNVFTTIPEGAIRFANIPFDRYPLALVISTANYPFPHN